MKNYLVYDSIINLISINVSLYYTGKPPENKCSCNSCAFSELSITSALIFSLFEYCPLVRMFHRRKLKNRKNNIDERTLRTAFKDNQSTFKQLLK